jgi:hypothetical protein
MNTLLYIVPNDENCEKALRFSNSRLDKVLDARKVLPKPDWLVGVPTIVDIESKQVFEGTECLKYLNKRFHSIGPIIEEEEEEEEEIVSEDIGVLFLDEETAMVPFDNISLEEEPPREETAMVPFDNISLEEEPPREETAMVPFDNISLEEELTSQRPFNFLGSMMVIQVES